MNIALNQNVRSPKNSPNIRNAKRTQCKYNLPKIIEI